MSIQSPVKTYISCGVQTEDDIPPSQFSSLSETQPPAAYPNLASIDKPEGALTVSDVSSDDIGTRLLGTLTYESAYIQSKTSEHSERLPLLCKNKKYPGFGVDRRSNPTGGQQRIASLPNPPPLQNESIADRNTRVVSMPECLISNSTTLYVGNSSSFTDNGQSVYWESSGQRQWQHGQERKYLYDIPRTPSPPSSPDSVEIIGNEAHISGSFLRRPNSDDDGWVTWASSPPRPIPALHGPLSLPYARCPSGAEGTVIEGDDLSHKIWGLGVGDQHAHSTTVRTGKNDAHHVSQVATSGDEFSVHSAKSINEPNLDFQYPFSLPGPRAGVIDLSRPSTFYNSTGFNGTIQNLNGDRSGEGGLPRLSLSSGSTSRQIQNISSSDGLKIRHPSGMQYSGNAMWLDIMNDYSSNTHCIESRDGKRFRVGMPDLRTNDATRTFGANGQNRLNKSAPVFVPGLDWQAKDSLIQHSRDGSLSDNQRPRRMELFHNEIISSATPSPNWSPIFPHLVDIQTLTTPRHVQEGSMFPDPKIYSPGLDNDDYSTKLMAMVQQFKGQEYFNIAKRYPSRAVKQVGDFLGDRKGSRDADHGERISAINDNPSAHIPLDHRPSLSQQHPRSIPLARLIQRRLSSVPEEVGARMTVSQPENDLKTMSNAILQPETMPFGVNPQFMQPAETVEERPDHGELSAIVRLPRKPAVHGSSRLYNRSTDGKRVNQHEGREERRNNNKNSELTSATVKSKGENGTAKMQEKVSANDGSA